MVLWASVPPVAVLELEDGERDRGEVGLDFADGAAVYGGSAYYQAVHGRADLPLFFTSGSRDFSTSLLMTSVGNMRVGLGFCGDAGGHLRWKHFTIGASLDTGSLYLDQLIVCEYERTALACLTNQSM